VALKKMLGAFGLGGPSVEVVLSNPNTRPGQVLDAAVNLVGGSHELTIDHVTVGLVTRVQIPAGEAEHDGLVEFHRVTVSDGLQLRQGEQVTLPVRLPMPWEIPLTDLYGQPAHGVTLGLRTELAIARAADTGDIDPVNVHPLPVQEHILAAFAQLGFRFTGTGLEYGHLHGLHQTLPFYQEINFHPPPQYGQVTNEVRLSFVAGPSSVEVILELDNRAGMVAGGHDSVARYSTPHAADTADWAMQVDIWVREAIEQHRSRRARRGNG
jgi:sporulation-control protein